MRRNFLQVMGYIRFIGMTSLAITFFSVRAEGQTFDGVVNSLAYPTSAERFFSEGQQKFEQEIRRLQKRDTQQSAEPLVIYPATLNQPKELQEQDFLKSPKGNP